MSFLTNPSVAFAYDSLAGYVSGGRHQGVELTRGADGRPVTRAMCLNLEHYYARGAGKGMFVPRYEAPATTEVLSDG